MKLVLFTLLCSLSAFSATVKSGDSITANRFNSSTYTVGDIRTSLLDEATLQQNAGNCWVKMRGQDISTSDFGQIKRASSGNPNLVITLPDSTNLFLRDTGAGLGVVQEQDWKGFTMHNTVQGGYAYSHNHVYMGKSTTSYVGNIFVGYWSAPAAGMGMMWDNSEIRPRNMGVNYYIKINHECN